MKHFYIFDLFRNLIRKKNVFAAIYLILNIVLVCAVFYAIGDGAPGSIPVGIILYFVTAFIALSPVGEWILRMTHGCERIEDPKVLSRLEPLFFEVVERAQKKQTDYTIGEKITLYIIPDDSENAFACGRNTVCITSGLLECSDEEIKAILGHELGHLATHDTDLVLLITVGNFFISTIVAIFKVIIFFYKIVFSLIGMLLGGSDGLVMRLVSGIASLLTLFAVQGVMYVWTQFGVLMVMKTSRDAEYEADSFSCDLGYSEGLLSFFNGLLGYEYSMADKGEKIRVFSALASSHPSPEKRIAKIHERMGNTVEG